MRSRIMVCSTLAVFYIAGIPGASLRAQQTRGTLPPGDAPPSVLRITLEEAKQRAVGSNKLLTLASMNVQGKGYATRAMQSNYFPKVIGTAIYFRFDQPLGQVLTTRARPLLGVPPTAVDVNVLNRDSSWTTIAAVQPITDLLKVRQGVRLARADEQIAQTEYDKGLRELLSGVEQLYWGFLAVQRIQAGAAQGVQGAELLARTQLLEARIALVEARQGLQEANRQLAGIEEQLKNLLDIAPSTRLELVEPPLPILTLHDADEAIALALASSPEIRAAELDIEKAHAALAAEKVEYLPNIVVMGGYLNQTAMSYVQQDSNFVGVMGSYTFVDWGKRRNTIRERQNLIAMASLKLQQTRDTVRQDAAKALRDLQDAAEALKMAQELATVEREAAKKAETPEAFKNPAPLIKASKDAGLAAVALVKADLAYREAYVKLMALIGRQ